MQFRSPPEPTNEDVARVKKDFLDGITKHAAAVAQLQRKFVQAMGPLGVSRDNLMKRDTAAYYWLEMKIVEISEDVSKVQDKQAVLAMALLRGMVLGIFLSELGLASFITREK